MPVNGAAGLACTLPVALNDPGDSVEYITSTPHGGFVSFPSARLTEDADSQIRFAAGSSYNVVTVAKPVLNGTSPGPVFDSQRKRWVPAMNPQVVSPDGTAYVYARDNNDGGAMSTTRIRVVTVSTGADRLLLSRGQTDIPIAWTRDGIYVVRANFEASSSGLWLLDPVTGSARQISASGSWAMVSGGAAWGSAPIYGRNADRDYYPHAIDRLDLGTGKVTRWYSATYPDNVHLAATDLAGNPIIVIDHYHIFRLTGPSKAQWLFDSFVPIREDATPQFDAHGLWYVTLDVSGDIWLYADGVGLRKVAETGVTVLDIEGPCR